MIQSTFKRISVVSILSLSLVAIARPARAEGSVGSDDYSIAANEAWAGAFFTSTHYSDTTLSGNANKSGGGAGLRGQICLLCFLLDTGSYPRIRGGDLIGLEVGIGYQSPPGGSLGSTWALFRADFGLQVFVALNPKVELGLRYYYLDEGDFARDENPPFKNQDHLWVIQPAFRYGRAVAEIGIKANGASGTASYVNFGVRYLFGGEYWKPMKAFIGFNLERFGIDGQIDNPTGGQQVGTSYTARLALGIQN